MRLVVAGSPIALACLVCVPMLAAQMPADAQRQVPVASRNQTITVPEGTRIALALTAPIGTRISKPGDLVRTVVTFPVAVESVVAIPAGTFVEGVIDKVMRPRSRNKPVFQIHFTRMIFPNGYTVAIGRATAQPKGRPPYPGYIPPPAVIDPDLPNGRFDLQTGAPFPMPLPSGSVNQPELHKPPMWIAIVAIAGTAAVTTMVVLIRGVDHWLSTGTALEMLLGAPLTLSLDDMVANLPPAIPR